MTRLRGCAACQLTNQERQEQAQQARKLPNLSLKLYRRHSTPQTMYLRDEPTSRLGLWNCYAIVLGMTSPCRTLELKIQSTTSALSLGRRNPWQCSRVSVVEANGRVAMYVLAAEALRAPKARPCVFNKNNRGVHVHYTFRRRRALSWKCLSRDLEDRAPCSYVFCS